MTRSRPIIAILLTLAAWPVLAEAPANGPSAFGTVAASGLLWQHLSTSRGDLPARGGSQQQTGAVVADLDKDGVNDFVLSFRQKAPALVWYRRTPQGWERYLIDKEYLTLEAGGAVCDIDGDGNPDVVFGGDFQSPNLYWWQNPGPSHYDPAIPWKRYTVKKSGANQHHDQIFGDFLGTGRPQIAFWNQKAKKIFLAPIPPNPTQLDAWPLIEIFSGASETKGAAYPEGMAAADIDGDGKIDLLAGNYWFKHTGGNTFKAIKFADYGGRIAAGNFNERAPYPEIVVNSGDGVGPLAVYECTGRVDDQLYWERHVLLEKVTHGHSLAVADVDGDGHLDIFAAEMAKWKEKNTHPDNPDAKAWIFFGDGQGHFRRTVFSTGIGFHEARLADLDGDGLMDVLDKPYNWEAPRIDVWLQRKSNRAYAGSAAGSPAVDRHPEIGLQLYSLRDAFPKDVPGTMKLIREMGITDVEAAGFYNLTPEQFRRELDKAGLKASGSHVQYPMFFRGTDQIIKETKAIGAHYVVIPWIPHTGKFTLEDAHTAAANFNKWGAALREAGLQLGYHPHGYEFTDAGNGKTVFDVMMGETKPELVTYELDVFWAFHGGQDPVKLLQKYPGRFTLMHLKDMKKGTQTGLSTGQAPKTADVAIGTGQLDFPAIMKEAQKVGIKHYYIEDESPTSVEQIPQSLKYLRSLGGGGD